MLDNCGLRDSPETDVKAMEAGLRDCCRSGGYPSGHLVYKLTPVRIGKVNPLDCLLGKC